MNFNENDLERWAHEELRRLPGYQAPGTLAPRVMAALAAQRVWWRQPFWSWPRLAQVLFFGLMAASASFLVSLIWNWSVLSDTGILPRWLGHVGTVCARWWEGLVTLAHAANAITHSGLQPWLWGAVGICMAAYLVCLAAGTAVLRVAWKRI